MKNRLSMLTSREAVLDAISECDKMGREGFLKQYGYKHSRLYPLHYKGNVYDSKAIVGVAFGKQHGTPLLAREFSGGAATVVPTLERLGFSARAANHPAEHLAMGAAYFRKDLREQFGGQLQKGIWTPKEFPAVFIFSGESGQLYGYKDGWSADGIYKYTGEGQSGDMTFTAGNLAIRDHHENGKDLLLFEDLGKGKGVRYTGLFECASWEKTDGVDKNTKPRKIIVFNLIPVTTSASVASENVMTQSPKASPLSIDDLRKGAYAASNADKMATKSSSAKKSWYERSAKVRDYVLARAKGICEACNQQAPFTKKDGTPYLEPHHTTRLADEGPDHPGWVGAICPNCHRRIHSGSDGNEWNKMLQERIREKEAKLGNSL